MRFVSGLWCLDSTRRPIIAANLSLPLGKKFSIGRFGVGSDFTGQAFPYFSWQFAKSVDWSSDGRFYALGGAWVGIFDAPTQLRQRFPVLESVEGGSRPVVLKRNPIVRKRDQQPTWYRRLNQAKECLARKTERLLRM